MVRKYLDYVIFSPKKILRNSSPGGYLIDYNLILPFEQHSPGILEIPGTILKDHKNNTIYA